MLQNNFSSSTILFIANDMYQYIRGFNTCNHQAVINFGFTTELIR